MALRERFARGIGALDVRVLGAYGAIYFLWGANFLAVRSYGEGTESSGVVQIVNDLSRPIEDEDVILVEDIVDTGLTINYLLDLLQTRKPKSLKVCALLHKPARSKVAVPIDYLGFTIEDRFVIGYGLDFGEKYRGLPFLGVLQRA